MTMPMSHYENVGALFSKKGIEVYAYNVNYRPDFTDGELERSLEATRALGARIVSGAGIDADSRAPARSDGQTPRRARRRPQPFRHAAASRTSTPS